MLCVFALPAAFVVPDAKSLLPRLAVDALWSVRRLSGVQEAPLVLGRDVEVRESPGKGKGVFALRDLPEGCLLSRYEGVVITQSEYDRRVEEEHTSGDYALELTTGWIVDGEDPARSNWVRFINHNVRKQNCFAQEVTGAVTLETLRAVAEGEELFFDYGEEYWETRVGKRPRLKR